MRLQFYALVTSVALCLVCSKGWAQETTTKEKSKDATHAPGALQSQTAATREGGGISKSVPSRAQQVQSSRMHLGASVIGQAVGQRHIVRALWIKANNAYPLSKIDGVLARGEPKLQACYETVGSSYQGPLRVDFSLDKKGRVNQTQWVYADAVPEPLKLCMDRVLKQWSLPHHEDRNALVASVAFGFKTYPVYKALEPPPNGASASKARVGRQTVEGGSYKEAVKVVVRQHRNEIRYCYENELKKNPKLAGQVKVKITIPGDGSATSVIVSSTTLKNRELEECMVRAIGSWTFPRTKDGKAFIANYPFNFSS